MKSPLILVMTFDELKTELKGIFLIITLIIVYLSINS